MSKTFIKYRSGYKYQLHTEYEINTAIKPKKAVDDKYIKLSLSGHLVISEGYAWDGPSGPVVDTMENMRASLVHDALYQLMRQRKLSAKSYKDKADRLFRRICIQDGVPRTEAKIYYLGLKLGGKPSTDPANQKVIHRAPK